MADTARRHFITAFTRLGLGAALLPEALWARMEEEGKQHLDSGYAEGCCRGGRNSLQR